MTKLNWAETLARPAIVKMKAYAARGGVTDALHLDANENPYAPPPVKSTRGFNLYPEQQPRKLVKRLSVLYGVKPETLMVGRGADEGIEVLLRVFCEAGQDKILTCTPTFGYYKTCAQIQDAEIVDVPLGENFQWDQAAIKTALQEDSTIKIVFLCSPNNPSGNEISRDFVLSLCTDNPEVLVVVDEAYIEFSDTGSLALLSNRPRNLLVLRTLSKAYALAGVRVGVTIADKAIIDLMLKVLPPYPIARPVEQAVRAALSPAAMSVHDVRRREIVSERERVQAGLAASPYIEKIYPSVANFLFLDIRNEDRLRRRLGERDVHVRSYGDTLRGKVRVSIGSPAENTILLAAFGVAGEAPQTQRTAEAHRKTKETDIAVRINLDDSAHVKISTGVGFFDHMLEALSKHGGFGLVLSCKGDLHIDAHHTIEDCALVLGAAMKDALGDRAGIGRFGFTTAMDETQARVAIDLSGRPAFTFKGAFLSPGVGEFASEMCPHFFESLAQALGAAIQIEVEGENTHHMIEACFKGVGRALRPAFACDGDAIPSTKGVL